MEKKHDERHQGGEKDENRKTFRDIYEENKFLYLRFCLTNVDLLCIIHMLHSKNKDIAQLERKHKLKLKLVRRYMD